RLPVGADLLDNLGDHRGRGEAAGGVVHQHDRLVHLRAFHAVHGRAELALHELQAGEDTVGALGAPGSGTHAHPRPRDLVRGVVEDLRHTALHVRADHHKGSPHHPGAGQPIQSPLYEGATHQLHEGLGLIGAQPGATPRRRDDGHHGQSCSISLGKHVSPGALYSAGRPRGTAGNRGCYLLSSSSRSMAASPSVSAARAAAACSRWRSMVSCISASIASAFLSSTPSASASSPTRIWRALASMRFSPADRPRSWSRRHRSRTTSATLFWSPEVRRSWLAL